MMDGTRRSFDLEAIRADFPILSREVHGKPLVYLDSAASALRDSSRARDICWPSVFCASGATWTLP